MKTPGIIKEFRDFLMRGNIVDLAVAVAVGAAFTAVVTALVKDFITPLIAAMFGGAGKEFQTYAFEFHGSKFAYGDFVNSLITFLVVAAVVFFLVVTPVNHLMRRMGRGPAAETPLVQCPACLSEVPPAATRCAYRTGPLTPSVPATE